MAFMKSFSSSAKVFNKNWRTKMAPLALTNEQALFQKFSTLPDDICLKPAKMADKGLTNDRRQFQHIHFQANKQRRLFNDC
ncbi:tRNA pseudouridine synthase [Trichinella pseudospiralis]